MVLEALTMDLQKQRQKVYKLLGACYSLSGPGLATKANCQTIHPVYCVYVRKNIDQCVIILKIYKKKNFAREKKNKDRLPLAEMDLSREIKRHV